MIRRKKVQLGIAALVLLIANNVQSQEVCGHQCQTPYGTQELNYQQRTTYSYDFTSDLELSLPNAQGQKSNTKVQATALLTPQAGCSFTLQLQNFKIVGANSQTYENIDGIDKPVSFQYLNGAIGVDICAEEDDPPHSLNVKRAVISMFQLDSLGQQTDVFGVCPTKNIVQANPDGSTIIVRTRNLKRCDRRENFEQNFMVDGLKDKRILESIPILHSDFMSAQNLQDGVLQRASIFENYTFIAFKSPEDNGVKATVRSFLQYVGVADPTALNFSPTKTKSIIFDKVPQPLHKHTANAIFESLKNFTRDYQALSDNSGSNFLNLIKIMRDSSKDDLISVYKYVQSGGFDDYVRKLFLDALFRCGTTSAMTAGMELASGKELRSGEEQLLYIGFSYVRHPTVEILKVAADLLDDYYLPKETYLGIGNLVRRYCEQRSCPDSNTANIMFIFKKKLHVAFDDQEIVYILKALQNAGHLTEETSRRVLAIAQNPQGTMRTRSMAVDVLSTAVCRDEVRNGLLHVLQNTEEDSEMRIKSYLALTKCPNAYLAQAIESLVNAEPSYQVGGFIVSHLKTLRNILSTINIQKTFPQDPRKFSFANEFPQVLAGIASKTTTNVVYSQRSFLPRFAKVNTTADILGSDDTNFLEVELRQENFDRLLEFYLGPMGVLQKENTKNRAYNEDLSLDVSVKLFGSDLLFLSLSERLDRFPDRLINDIVQDVTSKMNFETSRQNNMIFVDSQISYPTSLGFPLRLSVEGVTSVQFRLENNSTTDNIRWGFLPSANVEIISGIGVDARVVESGVKIISKVHVATGAFIDLTNNEVKMSLPLQEQQASVSHDLFFNVRELGGADSLKLLRFRNNDETTECIKRFSEYTGLDLCVKINAPPPSPNAYLSGSYKAALSLNNTDFSHVSLAVRNFDDKKATQFSGRVVGRRQNTKTGLIIDVSLYDGFMAKATAILPRHNASVKARFISTNTEQSIFGEIRMDNKKLFGKVGVGMTHASDKHVYSPLIYVAVPGEYGQVYPVNTKGSVVIYQKAHHLKVALEDLQLIFRVDRTKIYSVNGRLGQDKHGYFSDLTFSDGGTIINMGEKLHFYKNKLKFNSHVTNNRNLALNLHVNYEFLRKPSSLYSLLEIVHGEDSQSKLNRLTVENSWGIKRDEMKTSNKVMYPAANFEGRFDYESDVGSTKCDVKFQCSELIYGTQLNATYMQKHPGDYDVKMIAYDASNRVGITGSRSIQGSINFVNHTFFVNKDSYELSGQIVADRTYSLDLVWKALDLDPIHIIGRIYQDYQNGDYSLLVKDKSSTYVDFKLATAPASNDFKLLVYAEKVLKIDAQFMNGNTNGVGSLIIDDLHDYSVKLELTYSITSLYFIQTTLYPNFRKQPTMSVGFITKTQIDGQTLDSRNSLQVEGQSLINANLMFSQHFGETNAEIELTTRDGMYGTVKFKEATAGDYNNYMKRSYDVYVEFRNSFNDRHKKLHVRLEKKDEVGKDHKKALIVDTENIIIDGPLHVTTAIFTVYRKPWTYTHIATMSMYAVHEAEGIHFEGTSNYLENSVSNYVVNYHGFNNREELFFNGTYTDKGWGTPKTVNVTSSLKTDSYNLFNAIKANYSAVITRSTQVPNYNIQSETEVLVTHERGAQIFHIRTDMDVGPEDGKLLMTLSDGGSDPIVLSSNYSMQFRQRSNVANFNLDVRQAFRSYMSTRATFLVNELQCDGNIRIAVEFLPFLLATSWTYENPHKFVFRKELNFDVYTTTTMVNSKKGHLGLVHTSCNQQKPCFEIRAHHMDHSGPYRTFYKESLLLDLRYFGGHKIDVKKVLVSTQNVFNLTGRVTFNDHTKYASECLIKQDVMTLSLQTPHRQVVLDGHYANAPYRPKTIQLDFYPNKIKAQQKTSLKMYQDCHGTGECNFELRFADPNLPKDLVVACVVNHNQEEAKTELNVILDIFKREEDKIVITSNKNDLSGSSNNEIKSKGLDFNLQYKESFAVQFSSFEYIYYTNFQFGNRAYYSGFVLSANDVEALVNITVANQNVFKLKSQRSSVMRKTVIDTDVEMIGARPMYARLEVANLTSLNFTAGTKGYAQDVLQLTAKILGGDIARVKATKNHAVLSFTSLTMVGNRIHFDYRYDARSIKNNVLKPAKNVVDNSFISFERFLSAIRKDLYDHLERLEIKMRESTPDFNGFYRSYQNEMDMFTKELRRDPAVHDLVPIMRGVIDPVYELMLFAIKDGYHFTNTYVSMNLVRQDQMIRNNLVLTKNVKDVVYDALIVLNELCGKYEKDVRDFGFAFFATLEDAIAVSQVIKISLTEAYKNFKDTMVFNRLVDGLDQGPPASDELIRKFREIMDWLKRNAKSAEMMKLLELVDDYTQKKLKNEHVDDEVVLEKIGEALDDVLRVIYNSGDGYKSWHAVSLLVELGYLQLEMGLDRMNRLQLNADHIKKILVDEYEKMKIPEDFTGVITKDHIFTFDGKHVTLNGDCTALMAEDATDGNFSLSASYHGSLNSLTIRDKENTFVVGINTTLYGRNTSGFKVSINYDQIVVKSKYGVEIKCDVTLVTCIVKVSGYYHAHLKGLLGNANHETYDDFARTNGQIMSNADDFLRSYTTGNCQAIQMQPNAQSYSKCSQLFSQANFRSCVRFVNPKEYEIACNEGLQSGIVTTENTISRAYTEKCRNQGINIRPQDSATSANFIVNAE